MRILIIGGTAFVGRHIARAAVDAGHEVTLFHRGQTGAAFLPQATHLTGDRDESLAALRGRGGHHLLISSVSAYRTPVTPGYREDAPLAELSDPATQELTAQTYGGLKVACERAALELYGPAAT